MLMTQNEFESVCRGRSLQVEAARTNDKLDILEAKGGIVIVGVLPWPKKEEEG